MRYYKRADNCLYNPIHVKFNEVSGIGDTFSYTLQYPSFFNFKNTYFNVNQNVLNNINSTINSDVLTFKNGLVDEEKQVNADNIKNSKPQVKYKVVTNYAVTFNKNHILSTIVSLMSFVDNEGPRYNELNNYNFDLLTGNEFTIGSVFNPNVDYLKVITNYVNYKISQNKELYYKDVVVDIPEDQAFYLTDEGIVIYFGVDEITPNEFGIPRFTMEYKKFAPYINPRFYCTPENIYTAMRLKSNYRR